MHKCSNCGWAGEYSGKVAIGNDGNEVRFCPKCGDSSFVTTPKPVVDLDINNDGRVDKEDMKIVAKALGSLGGKKTASNKKKVKK
jgi:ribosomal protein S27AE